MIVDTSHLSVLGRTAHRIGHQLGEPPLEIFGRLVRASSCWRLGRLVTSVSVFDLEMDPSSDASKISELLGITDPVTFDWTDFVETVDDPAADTLINGDDIDAVGKNDCTLIGNALLQSRTQDVFLVTNDEDLVTRVRVKTRHLRKEQSGRFGNLVPLPSLTAIRDLASCGAISLDLTGAVLASEYDDIHSRPLDEAKKRIKLDRIRKVAMELRLPEPRQEINDADVWEYFLSKDADD